MKEHKFKVLVLADGTVVVDGVPVVKGQQVEVTITIEEPSALRYPLRGLPVFYEDPFGPATDESDWNALN